MGYFDNNLAMFNASMIRNKRELVESIEDYIAHHQQDDNGEEYNKSKEIVILDICNRFLTAVKSSEIPTLTKPYCCYRYFLRHDGIRLIIETHSDVVFNDDGYLSSSRIIHEQTILEVPCDFISVSEYAKLAGVSEVTVRQWIRRGKLRTARKNGRDWLIPILSEPPKRGYESATYLWERLPSEIRNEFPFLPEDGYADINQDQNDKKKFYALTFNNRTKKDQCIELTIPEREHLELMLLSYNSITVELLTDSLMYVPSKRNARIPYLSEERVECGESYIFCENKYDDIDYFDAGDEPGDFYDDESPDHFVLDISWDFYNAGSDDAVINAACSGEFAQCEKIGTLSGSIILNKDMIDSGCDPIITCDDKDGDLGALMFDLYSETGPLNEQNGNSYENIFYIYEFESNCTTDNMLLMHRIIRELPWICKRILHIYPELITYFISDRISENEAEKVQAFYEEDGFCRLENSKIMYAYTL